MLQPSLKPCRALSRCTVVALLFWSSAVHAQTTTFTYQGQLNDNGSPANGNFDMQFKLYDAPTAGNQIGSTITQPSVQATNGVFTTQLDFGAAAFPGAVRYLEPSVRTAGSTSAYTVQPRTQITSTPYAIRALSAGTADAGGALSASSVVTGADTPHSLPLHVNGTSWFQGDTTPLPSTVGEGVAVGYSSSLDAGYVFAYDYTAGAPKNLLLNSPGGNVDFGGNVGIGTTTPASKLHIVGNTLGAPFEGLTIDQTASRVGTQFPDLTGSMLAVRSLNESTIPFVTDTYFLVNSAGQVGIGTTTPQSKLHISGVAASDSPFAGLTIDQSVGGSSNLTGSMLSVRSLYQPTIGHGALSTYFLVNSAGRVGIGTASPDHLLGISGGPGWTSAGWAGSLELDNAAAIGWKANTAGNSFGIGHTNGGLYFFHTANNPGTSSSPAIYDLIIKDTGHVGVNVLEIQGGADLSEKFDVGGAPGAAGAELGDLQPGLLVSIDPEHPGKLRVSSRSYDRSVAGVISGAGGVASGMIMAQTGSVASGEQAVALNGRVYCWADAGGGPISPGDLLTTSDVPGHAMKVTNYAKGRGATIGKAMTGLQRGKGLVLVLVTLQ